MRINCHALKFRIGIIEALENPLIALYVLSQGISRVSNEFSYLTNWLENTD